MRQHRGVDIIAKRLCRLVHQCIGILASAMNSSVLVDVPTLMRNPDADVDMWLGWLSRAPIEGVLCPSSEVTGARIEQGSELMEQSGASSWWSASLKAKFALVRNAAVVLEGQAESMGRARCNAQ